MKDQDLRLAAARPSETKPEIKFTNSVMNKLTPAKKPHRVFTALRHSPILAAVLALVVLTLVSGTAYAIAYLWPQLHPQISDPHKTDDGRVSVIATDCDKVDSSKRYELKKDATVAITDVAAVVKAQCELRSVSDWASKTYDKKDRNPPAAPVNTPGATEKHVSILPAMFAVRLSAIKGGELLIQDSGSLQESSIKITPETKIIVDSRYGSLQQLKAGDTLAYVSKTTVTTKNRDDCTKTSCTGDIVSSTENILAIIKLRGSFDTYRAIRSLTEVPVCMGNPNDDCPNTGSIDVYEQLSNEAVNYAELTGKIVTYSDTSIVIRTSSGREVTIGTPTNAIKHFNTTRAADYGTTIEVGDTIKVAYGQLSGATNDTAVSKKQILQISLLVESSNKAGPYNKY